MSIDAPPPPDWEADEWPIDPRDVEWARRPYDDEAPAKWMLPGVDEPEEDYQKRISGYGADE